MKDTITTLKGEVDNLNNMSSLYDRIALEHGSADQTRAMFLESIFNQAIGNIEIAIKQLQILERELY